MCGISLAAVMRRILVGFMRSEEHENCREVVRWCDCELGAPSASASSSEPQLSEAEEVFECGEVGLRRYSTVQRGRRIDVVSQFEISVS